MFQHFFIGACFLAGFLGSLTYRLCIVTSNRKIREQWFIEGLFKGLYLIEHSNCDNCEKQEPSLWPRVHRRTIGNKMWRIMHVTTYYGKGILQLKYKYYDNTKENSELNLRRADIKDSVKCASQLVMTHSDNNLSVAVTICIFPMERLGWIMSSNRNTLMHLGVMKQIQGDLVNLRFQSGNVAVQDKLSVIINKLSVNPSDVLTKPLTMLPHLIRIKPMPIKQSTRGPNRGED